MRVEPIFATMILLGGCTPMVNQYPPPRPYIEQELILPDYSGVTEQEKREMGLLDRPKLAPKGAPFDLSRYDGTYMDLSRCVIDLQTSSAIDKNPDICYETAPSEELKAKYKMFDSLRYSPKYVRIIE
jgi:hypothetical protein